MNEHKVFDFNDPVTEAEWWTKGRIEQLEAEVKRLREALEARRDWFAMQLKSASKGNFSEWDRHALQIECDAADEALS